MRRWLLVAVGLVALVGSVAATRDSTAQRSPERIFVCYGEALAFFAEDGSVSAGNPTNRFGVFTSDDHFYYARVPNLRGARIPIPAVDEPPYYQNEVHWKINRLTGHFHWVFGETRVLDGVMVRSGFKFGSGRCQLGRPARSG